MPLAIGTPLPSFEGATHWLESQPDVLGPVRSSPLLVQFWAVSCPICKLNMPGVLSLLDTYRSQNLQLVSVHRPRMESDMNIEKVRAAAQDLQLVGPCALDNDHSVGDLFQTASVWPCYFFFDAEHKLRSRAAGQLGLKMAENSLKRLLAPELLSI